MKTITLTAIAFIASLQVASAAGTGYYCQGLCGDQKDMRQGRTVYGSTLEEAQSEFERVCGEEGVDLDKLVCKSYLL